MNSEQTDLEFAMSSTQLHSASSVNQETQGHISSLEDPQTSKHQLTDISKSIVPRPKLLHTFVLPIPT